MKQISSPMPPVVVTSSSPSRLRPPSPQSSRLRPPPDPPPHSSFLLSFEARSPPEPPDPLDESVHLVLLFYDTPFTLSQEFSQTPNLELSFPNLDCDGASSFVFYGDTSSVSKCLYSAVSNVILNERVKWNSHCSSLGQTGLSTLPLILVLFSSTCFHVKWDQRFVVGVVPVLLIMNLDCNVPMKFISFGSTFMPVGGSLVVLVRLLTAVCRFLIVFNPAFGAVILCYPSWWQIEGKLFVMLISVNRVMAGFHYPMASFVEQFLFPIFPSMWSELDVQVSLVLQGSSSWLMLFSAFVAVFVTFQVTRYAFIQEDSEIFVIRFLMFFGYDVYRQSICCLAMFQSLVALMYSPCGVELF